MRSAWNECPATFVALGEDGDIAVSLLCDLGVHCAPEDASAEHHDPTGVRWRDPESDSVDD